MGVIAAAAAAARRLVVVKWCKGSTIAGDDARTLQITCIRACLLVWLKQQLQQGGSTAPALNTVTIVSHNMLHNCKVLVTCLQVGIRKVHQ
jgi:hypothetical protein